MEIRILELIQGAQEASGLAVIIDVFRAFPQEELLNKEPGRDFFGSQTYCGAAEEDGDVCGLYEAAPNDGYKV